MPTPYPRYTATGPMAGSDVNAPGGVSAFKGVPAVTDPNQPGYTDAEHQASAASLNGGVNANIPANESALEKFQREQASLSLAGSKPVDEASIREQKRQEMQSTIDAIERQYQQIASQQAAEAEGRLGSTRASNSRSGLIGSDFGNANTERTIGVNSQIRDLTAAEKARQIAGVYTTINSNANDEIKAKKAEALGNANAYMEYLSNKETKVREGVKTLAAGGVGLEDLNTQQYQQILKDSGMDEFTLRAFHNENKPASTKTAFKYEVKGGKVVAYGVNPKTGELEMITKDLPAGSGIEGKYKTQFAPNGQLLLIPEDFDTTKSLDSQIIKAGNFSKPKSKEEVDTTVSDTLDQLKGADGFIDPVAYREVYQQYIKDNPGKGSQFFSNYPVNMYIAEENQAQFGK